MSVKRREMSFEEWRGIPKRMVITCSLTSCWAVDESGSTTYIDGHWDSIEEAERSTYEWLNAESLPPLPDEMRQRLFALGDERRRQKLSLRDVSPALGVSVSTLSNWERAIVAPSDEQLTAWEMVLAQGRQP